MAWIDKLKLKKSLILAANEAGFVAPKEIQQKNKHLIVHFYNCT